MARFLSALLALLLAALPVLADENTAFAEQAKDTLLVATADALRGDFVFDGSFSSAADRDVRQLLHGYALTVWQNERNSYDLNEQVVRGFSMTESKNGDRVYHLSLHRDLYYCDGTPITARDYAFSILLSLVLGGDVRLGGMEDRTYIAGAEAFALGETGVLTGVRVLNDHQLNVIVKAEALPFFYELQYLDIKPYPIHALAPGCEIHDEGGGVFVAGGALTAALLRETLLNPETGYQSHPTVTSGPYRLTLFENGEAEFELNPYYKGNSYGQKPAFRRIILRCAEEADQLAMLSSGNAHLLSRCRDRETLQEGLALTQQGDYKARNYAASGLELIYFCCERPYVASQAVRRAIACCFDKEAFIRSSAGRFGLRADGYYSAGQPAYRLLRGTKSPSLEETAVTDRSKDFGDVQAALEDMRGQTIPIAAFDLSLANELLAQEGWTLNEAGEAFSPGRDAVRCRQTDGHMEKLALTMACPNEVEAFFTETLAAQLGKAGISLTLLPMPAEEVRSLCFRQGERDCDMIYTEEDFGAVFDISPSFAPGNAAYGGMNIAAIQDESLYQLALDMRITAPGDTAVYCQRWLAFQEAFAALLPAIPVCTREVFDFSIGQMQDYPVKERQSWAEAIVGSMLGEILPEDTDGALQ